MQCRFDSHYIVSVHSMHFICFGSSRIRKRFFSVVVDASFSFSFHRCLTYFVFLYCICLVRVPIE